MLGEGYPEVFHLKGGILKYLGKSEARRKPVGRGVLCL
jgi:predicted sulfurtransferase